MELSGKVHKNLDDGNVVFCRRSTSIPRVVCLRGSGFIRRIIEFKLE